MSGRDHRLLSKYRRRNETLNGNHTCFGGQASLEELSLCSYTVDSIPSRACLFVTFHFLWVYCPGLEPRENYYQAIIVVAAIVADVVGELNFSAYS